jgi:hypothetical protein
MTPSGKEEVGNDPDGDRFGDMSLEGLKRWRGRGAIPTIFKMPLPERYKKPYSNRNKLRLGVSHVLGWR